MKSVSRNSYGGSRNSCTTCKIRHVKCDETKPNCSRCTKTGRKCDGYDDANLIKINPGYSLDFPGSQKERRAFDYFRSRTASSSHPALRHAAIALGSFHEILSLNPTQNGDVFALQQYAKAISQLKDSISRDKEDSAVAVMSCVLFVSFNSLIGHFDSAFIHLQAGLEILRSCSYPDLDLYRLFVRLGLPALFFVDIRALDTRGKGERLHIWEMCYREEDMPLEFTSLKEARDSLTDIFDHEMHHFYVSFATPRPTVDNPNCEYIEQRAGPDPSQTKRAAKLRSWAIALDRYLRRKRLSLASRDLRGATLLKIHYSVTISHLHKTLPWMTPAMFIDNYRLTITLCQSLLNAEQSGSRIDFSSDLGIVPVLYYVALNCPIFEIRLQALAMLETTPRRECMWDSRVLSLIIRRALELEEMASVPHQSSELDLSHKENLPISALEEMKASACNWLIYSRSPKEATEYPKSKLENSFTRDLNSSNVSPVIET